MPALLASMLTSVAIFLPILFMEGLEGQLFKDLAITMSVSHAASLLVAMTVIPAANRWALARGIPADQHQHWWTAMTDVRDAAHRHAAGALGLDRRLDRGERALIVLLLAPRVDYLPVAQTDLIWNNFRLPPGGNLETARDEFAPIVIERLRPVSRGHEGTGDQVLQLLGVRAVSAARPSSTRRIRATSRRWCRCCATRSWSGFPDTPVFVAARLAAQRRRRQRPRDPARFPGRGPDRADGRGARCGRRDPEGDPRHAIPQPFPSLELNQPELQLIPDEWRIARSGLTRTEVASSVRAFTGGLWAGEYFDGNERLDIIVKAREWRSPEELAELPIVTPTSGVQTVGELVELRQTVGPSQLVRINGHRTVSVNFTPPDDMTLDEALALVRDDVEPKVRAAMKAEHPADLRRAPRTTCTRRSRAMAQNFLLALVILFALMAALFRSVRDSVLVMLVMPASIAGGILALRVVGLFSFQALDLLTMIGFIILLGLVVNAAILLVDQTRARERHGMCRAARRCARRWRPARGRSCCRR